MKKNVIVVDPLAKVKRGSSAIIGIGKARTTECRCICVHEERNYACDAGEHAMGRT